MVQLIIRKQMYSDKGKRTLGEAIVQFIATRSAWPDSLVDFLEDQGATKLTTKLLIEWMALETGWDFMTDDYYQSSFETLIGRYKNWSHSPQNTAGDNTILMSAIALCGIVRDDAGTPITDIGELIRLLLNGRK